MKSVCKSFRKNVFLFESNCSSISIHRKMVDALKRNLRVPPRYVPYMEKHHLYEILQDIIVKMIQDQPNDHILFIKDRIKDVIKRKNHNFLKVVLLAPPHFDAAELAAQLNKFTKILAVRLEDVTSIQQLLGTEFKESPSELLARNTARFLKNHKSCLDKLDGWIFVDFPRTEEDAAGLQRIGILPSHTIQLYPSSLQATLTFMSPLAKRMRQEIITKEIEEYRLNLLGLRQIYQSTLIEVDIRDRSIEELAKSLSKVILQPQHSGAQTLPRIIIIGSRGSGMKTQAELLRKRFKIIHVDFENVLAKTRNQNDDLAQKVRLWESYLMPVDTQVLAAVLERRLMERDCLDQGWVLTGYPKNLLQFMSLDEMDIGPNNVPKGWHSKFGRRKGKDTELIEVIFLDVDPVTCMKHITLRGVNKYTGSQHNLLEHRHFQRPVDYRKVVTHPKNETKLAKKQLCYFHANLNEMLAYASGTEILIDGNSTIKTVAERVQAAVMRPRPVAPQRDRLKTVRYENPKKYSLHIADWIVQRVVENAVREINAVEGSINEMIERVMLKTERNHMYSILNEVVDKQWKLSKKQRVHFDDEHQCLAIVRGIPRAKKHFKYTQYGKLILAYEKIQEELLEAQRMEKELDYEREHKVQFMIDQVKKASIKFVDELIATAINKCMAIRAGKKRDVFVLQPLRKSVFKPQNDIEEL